MTMNSPDAIVFAGAMIDIKLWHNRLGHMSDKQLKLLRSDGKQPCLKTIDIGLCENCGFRKQTKVSFSKIGKTLKKQKLKLMYSDLWRPVHVISLGDSFYYLTFIDDSTRKIWDYFLKHKHDAFDVFRKWKVLVENKTGLKVKYLRFDNGREYELSEFNDFYDVNGIIRKRPSREHLNKMTWLNIRT